MRYFLLLCLSFFYCIPSFSQTSNLLPQTGKVGVGTTSPAAKLDVVGSTKLNGTLGVTQNVTFDKSLVVYGDFKLPAISSLAGNGAGVLMIDPLGNIGLDPRYQPKPSNSNAFWWTGGNVAGSLDFLGTLNNRPLEFRTFDQPRMTILGNGRVGIGTSSPQALLDVNGEISFRSSLQGNFGSASFKLFRDATIDNGSWVCFSAQSGEGLLFTDNASNPVVAISRSDRKVGIGTTDVPANVLLAVKGRIKAQAVQVSMQNWSDFVFSEDYELPPLAEVEEFIEINGHLPNVPSEETVRREGVDLGETEALLLQKIEELTLYIIEQEKRIRELEVTVGTD